MQLCDDLLLQLTADQANHEPVQIAEPTNKSDELTSLSDAESLQRWLDLCA